MRISCLIRTGIPEGDMLKCAYAFSECGVTICGETQRFWDSPEALPAAADGNPRIFWKKYLKHKSFMV